MRNLRVLALVAGAILLAAPASAKFTHCKLSYQLSGWSVFYKQYKGTGTVSCDDGTRADVTIVARGGGLTFGQSDIDDGHGTFSEVRDIDEVFGTYASTDAHAGAGPAVDSTVMTKGQVSLALSGKGRGINLGFSFGGFTIRRK